LITKPESMQNFTPFQSLTGGVIIGIGALLLLWRAERIAGISGIIGGLLHFTRSDTLWRLVFLTGLLAGGVALIFLDPSTVTFNTRPSKLTLIVAGLLVGFGTRLGDGCTSGHGICGLGRLAPRSMVAVFTFLTTGIISAVIVSELSGGAI